MIEWIESKKIKVISKKYGDYFATIKMALRVCDKCGKTEEARFQVIAASRKRRGGEEKDYCYKCSQIGRPMPRGKNDPKWKHGKTYNGYNRICVNGKRILEHVHVIQQFLGRSLTKGETVHHIDMDKSNNCSSNLYLFSSQAEHQKCHVGMERVGFKLLNKFIWFDWDKKQYVLVLTQVPDLHIEIPEIKKLHVETGYYFYKYKNEFGRFNRKPYHCLVAETILGRRLYKDECVHHVDGNKLNNNPKNLCIVKRREHVGLCHCSLQRCVAQLYKQKIVGFDSGSYSISVPVQERESHEMLEPTFVSVCSTFGQLRQGQPRAA